MKNLGTVFRYAAGMLAKKPHTGRSTSLQILVMKCREYLISQRTNALTYLKVNINMYVFYNKTTFKGFRGYYSDAYLWQLLCSSST